MTEEIVKEEEIEMREIGTVEEYRREVVEQVDKLKSIRRSKKEAFLKNIGQDIYRKLKNKQI